MMFTSFIIFLSFQAIIYVALADWGDPPEYNEHEDILMALSAKQHRDFIIDAFRLPLESTIFMGNPGMAPWPFTKLTDGHVNDKYPNMILIYAAGNSVPGHGYMVLSSGPRREDWRIIKHPDYMEVFDDHHGTNRRPYFVNDARVYNPGDLAVVTTESGPALRIAYYEVNEDHTSVQEMRYTDIYYNPTLDALYTIPPIRRPNIEEEVGTAFQKNWSPFIYQSDISSSNDANNASERLIDGRRLEDLNLTANFFIFSVHPHRIVHSNDYKVINNKLKTGVFPAGDHQTVITPAKTIVETQLLIDPNTYWGPFGPIHGGTPGILIETIYGPRYLTFFHSHSRYMISWCLTYFMGAYLFQPHPPFAITHITKEPIIPNPVYNQTFGWAYKAIDYIVFPMGLHSVDNQLLYLLIGRNDNAGWMILLNQTMLVASMEPVESEIKVDNFDVFVKEWKRHQLEEHANP